MGIKHHDQKGSHPGGRPDDLMSEVRHINTGSLFAQIIVEGQR
jgi:hypothetical protein